jgi:hypothetical protein
LTRRPFWLIVRQRTREMEVLTIGSYKEVLPVFSFNEEAEMFLRFGVSGTGWRIRESTCGELTSALYTSCRDIEHVALDPLPEMVAEGMVGFVSLSREAFIGVILPSDPIPSVVEEPRIVGVPS